MNVGISGSDGRDGLLSDRELKLTIGLKVEIVLQFANYVLLARPAERQPKPFGHVHQTGNEKYPPSSR